MGRKPVPMNLKRDTRLVVMLTSAEMEQLENAAANDGAESLSAWVRDCLLAGNLNSAGVETDG